MIKKDAIITLFERSWGEVDWILPVLIKLKELNHDLKIVVIFSELWSKWNSQSNNNLSLQVELKKVSDEQIYLENVENIHSILSSINNVKIILKDKGRDVHFKKLILSFFSSAKIIAFPHHTASLYPQHYNHPRNFNEWEKATIKHDVVFNCTQDEADFNIRFLSNLKQCVVGFPRYDRWWVERLLNSEVLRNSPEAKISASKPRVFLFLSRWITREAPEFTIKYIMKSVTEEILKDKNNFLFIKLHPRENASTILPFLKNYENQYMISNLHNIQLAAISDFVVSVWTSSVLDILCTGKPLLEFFQFLIPNSTYSVNSSGQLVPFSRLKGYVVPVDTREELKEVIHSYFLKKNTDVWKKQQEAFRKICPDNNDASLNTAKIILKIMSPGFETDNLASLQFPGSLLTDEKNLFLNKKQSGALFLHLKLKKISGYGMPVSSIFFKELARVFSTNICVLTGTFNEIFASEAAKIFKEIHTMEVAADLYQASTLEEIVPFNNIYIYNSANLLKTVLPGLKGKILFWLSSHESAGITTKSKTNAPIIEELKAIRESNIKNAVIIINNIRYFQPIAINEHEAQRYRKYPSMQETMDAIFDINPKYRFVVLGDIAMAYLPEYPVTVAPSIHACTLSRIFNNDNIDLNNVFEAENFIAYNLPKDEKQTLQMMYDDYFSYEEPGVGGHYRLWRGLTYMGEKQFEAAKEDFFIAYQLGCKHWRIIWYLAQSSQMSGDINLAKEAVRAVIKAAPHFKPAINLSRQIGE